MYAKFLYADASSIFRDALNQRITTYKSNRDRFHVDTARLGVEVRVTDRTNSAVMLVTLQNHSASQIPTPYSVAISPFTTDLRSAKALADFNESAEILKEIFSR